MIFKRVFHFAAVLAGGILFNSSLGLAEDFSGTVLRSGQNVFLACASGCTDKVELRALTADSQKTLDRLQNDDFLEGSGGLINGAIVLDSVDFVGLANLLGTWRHGRFWIQFKNFNSTLMFLAPDAHLGKTSLMQYSIVPGANNTWRVLFSNDTSVTSASLSFENNTLKLQFSDDGSGTTTPYVFWKSDADPSAAQP